MPIRDSASLSVAMRNVPLYKSWSNVVIDVILGASSSDSNVEAGPDSLGEDL